MPGTDELEIKYTDIMRGLTQRVPVGYGNLSQYVRDKIAEADLTEHELLERIVIQMKINNRHRAILSDEEVTEDDINWP